MPATCSPTPWARASSSIPSMRMRGESMSMTISRLLRRSSDSGCKAQSKAPSPAACKSACLRGASSPDSETANSTEASPPSESRWIRSMFAPWRARISETCWSCRGPSVRAMTVSAYRCGAPPRDGSGSRSSNERPSSRATKSNSLSRACSSSTSTANPSVSSPCTTTCSTSVSRAPACARVRDRRAVMPGASRPVKVRISSATRRLLHGGRAGAALSRRRRDRFQTLGAGLGRRSGSWFLQQCPGEEEHDQRDDDEVDEAAGEVAVLDGVLAGERELRVAPVARGQRQAEDRHEHVLDDAGDHLADGGADDHADGQRDGVLLEQELPELGGGLLHGRILGAGPPGGQALRADSLPRASGCRELRRGLIFAPPTKGGVDGAAQNVAVRILGVSLVVSWDPKHADTFAAAPAPRANPEGITVDGKGNVFVADFEVKGNPPGHVVVFDRQGKFLRDLAIPGSSNMLLGIAFQQSTGKLLVIDFGNGQVLRVDPVSGAATPFTVIGPGSGLNGLTFDKAGNVYISDSFQGAIFKVAPTGGPATLWKQDPLLTTAGVPPFGANGLAFNHDQSLLFVANTGNDTIVQIANAGATGGAATVFTNSINGADGLIIDEHDNLWVCANQADEIVVVDPTGKAIAKLGDFDGLKKGAPDGLLFPASLVFDGDSLLVTNLSLDLRLFGSNTVEAQWAPQVPRHTVARLPRRIPDIQNH